MTELTHGPGLQPQARYILPSFIEHSSFGVKESNPYNKLFEERIIFLGVQVDDASANDIMAQLLVLESLDPDRDITMYINSPGGSFTSLMAIYDTMQYVRADIQTVCLGQAASAAAVLLAAGSPGQAAGAAQRPRPDPPARALAGVIQGQFSDLEIQAKEIERMRTLMETTLAHHTGKDAAVDPQGHRPRQDPDRRGGQGVRRSSTRCWSTASSRLRPPSPTSVRSRSVATVRNAAARRCRRAGTPAASADDASAPAATHRGARSADHRRRCRSRSGGRRPRPRRCSGRR